MKMRHRDALLVSAAALIMLAGLSSAPARADALTPISGNYQAHFNNMEDFYDPNSNQIVSTNFGATGQENFGINVLGNITSTGGGTYNGPTGTNDYLVGVFGGITVGPVYNNTTGAISTTFAPGTTAFATGGSFRIYEIPVADFPSLSSFISFMNSTGPSGFTGAGCGTQTLAQVAAGTSFCYSGLTTLAGVTDVLNINLVNGFNSFTTSGGTVIPLGTNYTLSASFSASLTGVANAWGDAVGGADGPQFENAAEPTDIGTLADIKLIDDFCPEVSTCGSTFLSTPNTNWTAASSDPISGTTIPEPGSLAIFGTALLGVVEVLRRRRKRA